MSFSNYYFQSRIFAEIRENSTESSLNNSYRVNEIRGLLAICKVNQVHPVILFEYLQKFDGNLQRTIIQIDFGPDDNRNSIAGKIQHQEFVGENEILANIRNLKVGKNWLCDTGKVLRTFAAIKSEVYDCTNIPTSSSSAIRTNRETEVKRYILKPLTNVFKINSKFRSSTV